MRFLLNLLAQIALAAVALVVIHFALPGVTLHLAGFVIALVVFTIAYAILRPLVRKLAQRYAEPLTGGVGLIATLLALWIATLFKGGIVISGVQAWLLAPAIVWIITALGGWIVGKFVIDRSLEKRDLARKIAHSKK